MTVVLLSEVVQPIVGLTAERWEIATWFMSVVVFSLGTLIGFRL